MHCTYGDTGFPTQIADVSTHQLSCASHPPGFYALKRHNTSNSIIQQQRLKNSHYNHTFYTPFREPGAQQRRSTPANEHQLSCASYLRRLYARTTQHRYTARHNNPEIKQLSLPHTCTTAIHAHSHTSHSHHTTQRFQDQIPDRMALHWYHASTCNITLCQRTTTKIDVINR